MKDMGTATKEETIEIHARKDFERDLLAGKFERVETISWATAPEYVKDFYLWLNS